MAVEANAPFLWGAGGRRLTPEEILMERKASTALGSEAMSTAPVGHWSQGLNRVLQGLMAGYDGYSADQASKQNGTESAAVIQALLGGNAAPATSGAPVIAPAAQAAPVSTPMGATAIPSGTMDPGLRDAISSVATARGIDPAYMTRLAMVESGGNPNAASPLSSAKGPFQFINSTAQQYGLTNPKDPAASADAAARLTLDNKAALTQALGREPTPGELYLAHQQGAGGAAKLLANPNAPVESIIGQQAAANNGAAPGMTAGQFASKWTGKFSDVGGAAPAAAPRPAINPAIVQAISSPYMSDSAKKIGTMLFQNNLEQQQKASDPLRQAQLAKLQQELTPLAEPTLDKQGNLIQRDPLGKVNVLKASESRPTSVSEYEYYKTTLPQGQQPMPYDTWATAKARAGAMNVTNNVGGGSDKQIFDTFSENTKEARAAANGLVALRSARQALQGPGGAITGFGADEKLTFQKLGAALGVADPAAVQNTETFRAAIAPQVASMLKSTVGSANISNSDREFAEKAAGGSIKLDGGSINRLLDIMEKAGSARLDLHQQQLDAVYPDPTNNKRERALFGVQTPAAAPQPEQPVQQPVTNGAIAVNPKTGERRVLQNGKWVPVL